MLRNPSASSLPSCASLHRWSFSLKIAADPLQGMLGLHGIGLSQSKNISVARMKIAFWIAVPAFIALVCPNTLRILSRHEPALGWNPSPHDGATLRTRILWGPSLAWAAAVSIIMVVGIPYLGGQSEFL